MTLRFFGRAKSTTTKKAEAAASAAKETAAPAPKDDESAAPRRTRRGRRGSGATKKADAAASKAAESPAEKEPAPEAPRARRGRRGGVGRKPAAPRTSAAAAEPASGTNGRSEEVAPVAVRATAKAPAGSMEALLARQETMIEEQLAALRSVQTALSSIDLKLGTVSAGTVRQRVGVFVDVPNIMYAAERLRTKVDYSKMLSFLVRGRDLVRASAYAPISDDLTEPIAAQKFVQPFMGFGYAVITKPLKRYGDGTIKANFDVELAIDILTMCERLDVVVLVSGDGDFRRLVELVCSKGVRVEVAAFGDSTAAELRSAGDQYVDLADHLAELRTA